MDVGQNPNPSLPISHHTAGARGPGGRKLEAGGWKRLRVAYQGDPYVRRNREKFAIGKF